MAAGDNEVNIKFGATIDDFKSKMGEVSNIFKAVVERFGALAAVVAGGAAFKSFINTANEVNTSAEKMSRTLGITAAEAGVIGMAVDDVAASMGIGGASAETYTGAFLKFNRQLRTNSDSLRALGVDVDAVKNGTKTSNEVFQEAVQIVGKYAPGIDQTQVAMQLFGRSVQDVQLLMGITSEKIEEARKKAEELNLTITTEGVEGARKYRSAMNDVHDVLEGLEKTIGEGVMPVLTESAVQLASIGPALVDGTKAAVEVFVQIWQDVRATVGEVLTDIMDGVRAVGGGFAEIFGGEAPSAMQVFRNALGIVQAAWIAFRIGFQEVFNVVKVGLQLLGAGMVSFAAVAGGVLSAMKAGFVTFANVADRALHLDLTGVVAAVRAGGAAVAAGLNDANQAMVDGVAERNRILAEGAQKAIDIAVKGQADLQKALVDTPLSAPKKGTAAGAPTGGTKKADISKEDKGNGGEKLAADLALKKAQLEAEKALSEEFLKEMASINDEAYKNNLVSIEEYYATKETIEKKANEISLATKRAELKDAADAEKAAQESSGSSATPQDKAKYDTQALKFKTEQVKLQGEINVLEAQGNEISRKNAQDKADAERKLADELATIASTRAKSLADDQIADATAVLQQKKALRQIDAEDAFAAEKDLEQRSYAATLEQIQAKRALIHGDQAQTVKERAQLDAEAEAAERQHQQKLSTIDRAAELERKKYSIQAQQSTQSAFSTMVNDLLSGTKKISDVFRNFGISVANTFTNLIAQKFTERLFDVTGANAMMDKIVSFFVDGIAKMVTNWVAGKAAQSVASESMAVTEATTTAIANKASVLSYASVAAVAAMASVAAIPFYGWAMAPEVGAATYATGLGYMLSAKGGLDEVPSDQIMQVHKKEMILSAPLAQGLRDLVGDGGLKPLTNTVNQIVNNLAPDAPARENKGALDLNAPQPADAATSKVAAAAPAEAPVKTAAPLPDPIKPLAPEQRPVPADAAVSIAAAPPAPEGRSDAPPPIAAPLLPSAGPESAADAAIATAPVPRPQEPGGAALSAPGAAPAPQAPVGNAGFPAQPVPADAATAKVAAPAPADAPVKPAVPLVDSTKPLPPEARPVAADASISVAVSAPSPEARSAPPAQSGSPEAAPELSPVAPEPPRPAAPAGAALPLPVPTPVPAVANAAVVFPAQPVAADAATSLVLAKPQPAPTAAVSPGREQQVAAAGQETTPPAERQAAKTLAATNLPTLAKLSAPEVPQPAIASTAKPAESDVGKMVVRWLGDDQNRPLSEGRGAMGKLQSVAAGQPANGGAEPWWRVPSSPLGRIQQAANGGAGAGGNDGGLGPRRESSAAPVQLVGATAGDFFIAHTKDLLKVLNGAARNNRRPGA